MTGGRHRPLLFAVAALFVCFTAWPGCSRKKGVEIYKDGDVTVVHNPENPSAAPGGPSGLFLKILNLKPVFRDRHTQVYIASQIAADLAIHRPAP